MEICNNCPNVATFVCMCRRPGMFLCEDHLERHQAILPFVTHSIYKYPVIANENSKNLLKSKIEDMINSCHQKKAQLNVHLEEIIQLVTEVAKNTNEILANFAKEFDRKLILIENFIEDLQEIHNLIDKTSQIPIKSFLTPLELALLSHEKAKNLVESWSDPQIACTVPDFKTFLSFIPSNIYSSLNFSKVLTKIAPGGLYFSKSGTTEMCANENLDDSYGILPISSDILLITGGKNAIGLSYTLNLANFQIEHMPLLEVKRKFHAMAWVNNYPAILGGEKESGETLDSVEILKENEWDKKKIPKMIAKRKKFSVCNSHCKTYAFGGNDECSLEVFDGNNWREIAVKMEVPIRQDFLVYDCKNLIFLSQNGKNAFYLDLEENKIKPFEKKNKREGIPGMEIKFFDFEVMDFVAMEIAY